MTEHPFTDGGEPDPIPERNPNLNRALYYAGLGWKLFPAIWTKTHKGLIKWGENSTNDLDTIRAWADKWKNCYFCVALQKSDLTVIDVDKKRGRNGEAVLFDLEFENSALPDTIKSQTPSGGYHYIFKGKTPITVGQLGKGVDTPVMVPLPGTAVKGKGYYRLLSDKKTLPAELPQWLKDSLGDLAADRNPEYKTPLIELDQPHNISDCIKFLSERAEIAIEGDGGDQKTFKIACHVRDYGVSEPKALELMLEHWNEDCEPPWAVDELVKKINNAYNYAQNRVGESSAENEFSPLADGEPIKTDTGPIIISGFKGNPPPRDWVVSDWLPRQEITGLYGDGGLGKSLLALQLGMNVSSGEGTFLGASIERKMPVLAIPCEDTRDEAHRRIHSILKAPEYEFMDLNVPFHIWPRVGKESVLAFQEGNIIRKGDFYDPLSKEIERIGKGGDLLLIMDTLSDIFAINENDRQAASKCVKTVLGSLVQKYGCTILVLAHPSKASQASGTYDSGSTAWRNSLRNMWALKPHTDKELINYRLIQRTKSNYSAKSDDIALKWEKGRILNVDGQPIINEASEANLERLYNKIVAQAEKGIPLGVHHLKKPNVYLIDIIGSNGKRLDKKTVEALLNRLIMEDRVIDRRNQKKKNGLWPADMI